MRMVTADDVVNAAKAILDKKPMSEGLEPSPTKTPVAGRTHMLGLSVDGITYEEWLKQIDEWVRTGDQARHDVPHAVLHVRPKGGRLDEP